MSSTSPIGMLIAGTSRPAASGERFATLDPATGAHLADVALGAAADVDEAVAEAQAAFERSRAATAPAERARLLLAIAEQIRRNADELARLDAANAGLPSRMAQGDVATAARYFEFYAGVADKLHGESIPLGPRLVDYTELEPWGVCAVIPPFNAPIQVTARSLAPALAAGNAVVLKPAEQAPLPVLALGRAISAAGGDPGLVNVVPGSGPEAGQALVAHHGVAHITFTGSVRTGRLIMRAAAEQLTPVTLELGGKSPQIVFADADLERAVATIVGSALLTSGQVCSAGTRVLVERSRHRELVDALVHAAERIRVGRPADGGEMGPLISRAAQQLVLAAIEAARDEGAHVRTGGGGPTDPGLAGGFFVAPTILDRVQPEMGAAREEIFGPVLSVLTFEDEADAVRIANDSELGLVAGVWTRDIGRAHRMARALQVGQVYVNTYGTAGNVELPFGGYRKSGIGREKGVVALREYTQIKNVCIDIAS